MQLGYKDLFTTIFFDSKLYVDLKENNFIWTINEECFEDCISNDYNHVETIFNQLINKRKKKKEPNEKIIKYGK